MAYQAKKHERSHLVINLDPATLVHNKTSRSASPNPRACLSPVSNFVSSYRQRRHQGPQNQPPSNSRTTRRQINPGILHSRPFSSAKGEGVPINSPDNIRDFTRSALERSALKFNTSNAESTRKGRISISESRCAAYQAEINRPAWSQIQPSARAGTKTFEMAVRGRNRTNIPFQKKDIGVIREHGGAERGSQRFNEWEDSEVDHLPVRLIEDKDSEVDQSGSLRNPRVDSLGASTNNNQKFTFSIFDKINQKIKTRNQLDADIDCKGGSKGGFQISGARNRTRTTQKKLNQKITIKSQQQIAQKPYYVLQSAPKNDAVDNKENQKVHHNRLKKNSKHLSKKIKQLKLRGLKKFSKGVSGGITSHLRRDANNDIKEKKKKVNGKNDLQKKSPKQENHGILAKMKSRQRDEYGLGYASTLHNYLTSPTDLDRSELSTEDNGDNFGPHSRERSSPNRENRQRARGQSEKSKLQNLIMIGHKNQNLPAVEKMMNQQERDLRNSETQDRLLCFLKEQRVYNFESLNTVDWELASNPTRYQKDNLFRDFSKAVCSRLGEKDSLKNHFLIDFSTLSSSSPKGFSRVISEIFSTSFYCFVFNYAATEVKEFLNLHRLLQSFKSLLEQVDFKYSLQSRFLEQFDILLAKINAFNCLPENKASTKSLIATFDQKRLGGLDHPEKTQRRKEQARIEKMSKIFDSFLQKFSEEELSDLGSVLAKEMILKDSIQNSGETVKGLTRLREGVMRNIQQIQNLMYLRVDQDQHQPDNQIRVVCYRPEAGGQNLRADGRHEVHKQGILLEKVGKLLMTVSHLLNFVSNPMSSGQEDRTKVIAVEATNGSTNLKILHEDQLDDGGFLPNFLKKKNTQKGSPRTGAIPSVISKPQESDLKFFMMIGNTSALKPSKDYVLRLPPREKNKRARRIKTSKKFLEKSTVEEKDIGEPEDNFRGRVGDQKPKETQRSKSQLNRQRLNRLLQMEGSGGNYRQRQQNNNPWTQKDQLKNSQKKENSVAQAISIPPRKNRGISTVKDRGQSTNPLKRRLSNLSEMILKSDPLGAKGKPYKQDPKEINLLRKEDKINLTHPHQINLEKGMIRKQPGINPPIPKNMPLQKLANFQDSLNVQDFIKDKDENTLENPNLDQANNYQIDVMQRSESLKRKDVNKLKMTKKTSYLQNKIKQNGLLKEIIPSLMDDGRRRERLESLESSNQDAPHCPEEKFQHGAEGIEEKQETEDFGFQDLPEGLGEFQVEIEEPIISKGNKRSLNPPESNFVGDFYHHLPSSSSLKNPQVQNPRKGPPIQPGLPNPCNFMTYHVNSTNCLNNQLVRDSSQNLLQNQMSCYPQISEVSAVGRGLGNGESVAPSRGGQRSNPNFFRRDYSRPQLSRSNQSHSNSAMRSYQMSRETSRKRLRPPKIFKNSEQSQGGIFASDHVMETQPAYQEPLCSSSEVRLTKQILNNQNSSLPKQRSEISHLPRTQHQTLPTINARPIAIQAPFNHNKRMSRQLSAAIHPLIASPVRPGYPHNTSLTSRPHSVNQRHSSQTRIIAGPQVVLVDSRLSGGAKVIISGNNSHRRSPSVFSIKSTQQRDIEVGSNGSIQALCHGESRGSSRKQDLRNLNLYGGSRKKLGRLSQPNSSIQNRVSYSVSRRRIRHQVQQRAFTPSVSRSKNLVAGQIAGSNLNLQSHQNEVLNTYHVVAFSPNQDKAQSGRNKAIGGFRLQRSPQKPRASDPLKIMPIHNQRNQFVSLAGEIPAPKQFLARNNIQLSVPPERRPMSQDQRKARRKLVNGVSEVLKKFRNSSSKKLVVGSGNNQASERSNRAIYDLRRNSAGRSHSVNPSKNLQNMTFDQHQQKQFQLAISNPLGQRHVESVDRYHQLTRNFMQRRLARTPSLNVEIQPFGLNGALNPKFATLGGFSERATRRSGDASRPENRFSRSRNQGLGRNISRENVGILPTGPEKRVLKPREGSSQRNVRRRPFDNLFGKLNNLMNFMKDDDRKIRIWRKRRILGGLNLDQDAGSRTLGGFGITTC